MNAGTGAISINSTNTPIAAAATLNLGSNSTFNAGTGTITTNAITMGSAKNLTLTADDVAIGANISGSGTLLIQPTTSSRLMSIGSSAGSTLSLDTTEIGYFVNGWNNLVFGQSSGHYINIGATTWYDPVTFRGFVNRIQGNIQGLDNASLSFSPGCCAEFHTTGAVVSTAGNAINIPNGLAVYANNGSINSNGGAITIAGIGNMGTGFTGFTINTGGGALNISGNISQNAVPTTPGQYTFNSGVGITTFTGTVQTSSNIAATAGGFAISSNPWGSSTAPNNVSLTSANTSFTLPNLTATGNVSLNAGTGTLTTGTIATGAGNLTLTADSLTMGGNLTGTGALLIQPYSATRAFNINNGTSNLYHTGGMLDFIQSGWSGLTFGNSSDSALLSVGAYNWKNTVNFLNGAATINFIGGTSTLSNNASLNATTINGDINFTTSSGAINTSGTGGITIGSGLNLNMYNYATNLTASGTGAITLRANNSIEYDYGTISTQGGAITLNSDRDASGAGNITVDYGAALLSNGGDITFGGGLNPLIGYAIGAASYPAWGVNFTNNGGLSSSVNAGGGNIVINGEGWLNASCAGVCRGVSLAGSSLATTVNGNITINAIGGGTATNSNDSGFYMYTRGYTTSITTQNGDITVNAGTTDSTFSGAASAIYMEDTIKTTGTGNIVFNSITNGSAKGPITVNATVTSGGKVTLISDTLNTSYLPPSISAVSDIIIRPNTAGTTVGIGAGAGTLGITDNWLSKLTWGNNLWLGGYGNPGDTSYMSNAGNMTINSTRSFAKNINFLSAGNILSSGTGTVTTTSAGNILLAALGDINLTTAQNFTASGTGSITERANNNILHTGGAVLTTQGGVITLNSDRDADNVGRIELNTNAKLYSNGGNIILGGGADPTTGYARNYQASGSGNDPQNVGIMLNYATLNATGSSSGGNILLHGSGWQDGSCASLLAACNGIAVFGTNLQTNYSGGITFDAIAGGTSATTNYQQGLNWAYSSSATTANGDINFIGQVLNSGNQNLAFGAGTSGQIKTTGTGNINITAKSPTLAGGGALTIYDAVLFNSGNDINITADGISNNALYSLTAANNVSFKNYTPNATLRVGSGSGNVALTDTILNRFTWGNTFTIGGNATGNMTINTGVSFPKNIVFMSAGNITNAGANLTGTGTGGITLNAGNQLLTSAAGNITTSSGNINLTATNGIALTYATPITSSSGNITFNSPLTSTTSQTFNAGTGTITTNSMAVGTGNSLTITADDLVIGGNLSGTGTLTLSPYSNSRIINVNYGTADGSNWNLSTVEIARLVDGWSSVNIGGNLAGAVNIGAATWTDPISFLTIQV